MKTWEEAIATYPFYAAIPAFRDSYRNGWFDRMLGADSQIARTSPDIFYREGYKQGRCDWVVNMKGFLVLD